MKDPTPSPAPLFPAWARRALLVLVGIGIVAYVIFVDRHIAPYAGGSDSSGYLNSARLLSHGQIFTLPRTLPGKMASTYGEFSSVPLGFTARPDGRMVPTYPTGYPLQLIAASPAGWNHAANVLNILTLLACGILFYAYARRLGLNTGLALSGVVLLWLCPLFLFAAFQPMSDLSAVAWVLATLYCALLITDRPGWGLACGFALSIAVLVRPTNLLLLLPVAYALGGRPRVWLWLGLGGLPGAVFFALFNWRVYGSPAMTGYGNVWDAFRWEYLPHNLAHFARWVPALLSPLVVLALGAPFLHSGRKRGMIMLLLWALTLIGFYAFYYHSGETWWYLRFILPAFPALIMGLLIVCDQIHRAAKEKSIATCAAVAALLISAAAWQLWQIPRLDVLYLKRSERSYPDSAHWARDHLPADAVVFCMQVSGAFFYYTDFILFRYEQINQDKFPTLLADIAEQKRPIYSALYAFETEETHKRIGGQWTPIATVGQVTFWQRQP